ncbi:DUF2147 domain-containing protein [Sphingobium sp. GW456-12-10-14-TSB1]|jgi:uncharacterized protein (DUF2147 family)|uniref:DUF2147 domain-containing protein n=1 Tax=Sphingobium sp. GW456-12-10-14-TSB1 TaxID=1987165 RepID=UPI000A3D1419|nr:DUF2147 domain-containing protein [Sphingobium sp. GW456-12-10-14-TSB1]
MPADAAVGRWQTENRHGVVEIARCGSSICGTLLSSDGLRANPQLRDEKNKDAQLRSRPLKDLRILQGFQWKSGSWSSGTIYNAEDGGTYGATVTVIDSDHLRLKGCIVWPLCKTQTWIRLR